jgi:PAS domain S-box-containing protein
VPSGSDPLSHADASLRHGEEGLRLLAEHTRDVFYVRALDPPTLLYVSPAFEEVWGRPCGELYEDPSIFVGAVHPDDRERAASALPRQLQGMGTDDEYRIVRPDGSLRWIHDRGMPVKGDDGTVSRVVGIAADVTDRRRSEETLRLLEEASWLFGSSLDYEATLRNLAGAVVPRLADICAIDILEGSDHVRRLHVAHADPEWNARLEALSAQHPPRLINPAHPLERAIATGSAQLVPEMTDELLALIENDPERLEVLRQLSLRSAMVIPLVARGRSLGAITLATSRSGRRYDDEDVSLASEIGRRAAIAVDNAALYEAALAANKAKADFLAVVSHELRTPLSAIIGYADLLELGVGGELNAAHLARVERIKSGAWHLVHVIEGILSYTRLEAGREHVRTEAVELGRLVEESVALVAPVASERGIELRFEPWERPLWTVSDGPKLKQIVLNLVSNAVKFTEVGEVRVALREEEDAFGIDVTDTGIGIDPADVERIFDAFWQVEQPHNRRVGGTGLGLAVSRRLAGLLGGEVSVSTLPEVGSTFTVRLPRTLPGPRAASERSGGLDLRSSSGG